MTYGHTCPTHNCTYDEACPECVEADAREQESQEREIADLTRQLTEAREQLAEWPRVYWDSADPKTSTKGYRVQSVDGKTEYRDGDKRDVYLDVYVFEDYADQGEDPEGHAAPDDFGLYSTVERLEKSRLASTPAAQEQDNG